MKRIFLFFLLIISSLVLFSQESILLTSGKRLKIQAINLDSVQYVFYKTQNGKIKVMDREEVFSWTRSDSVEVIFYKPACEDVCFKIDQMRDYLHGIADASEKKCPFPTIIGIAGGAAAGVFVTPIVSPLVPAAVALGCGLPRPQINKFKINEKYANNPHYAEGYTQTIRRKRVINAVIGGGIGLVAGIITATVLVKSE